MYLIRGALRAILALSLTVVLGKSLLVSVSYSISRNSNLVSDVFAYRVSTLSLWIIELEALMKVKFLKKKSFKTQNNDAEIIIFIPNIYIFFLCAKH